MEWAVVEQGLQALHESFLTKSLVIEIALKIVQIIDLSVNSFILEIIIYLHHLPLPFLPPNYIIYSLLSSKIKAFSLIVVACVYVNVGIYIFLNITFSVCIMLFEHML